MTAAVCAHVVGAIKPDVRDIVQLVKAEYLEMPGLCLTRAQVQRLWDLDRDTSGAVLQQLVKEGFLYLSEAGTFSRQDWRCGCLDKAPNTSFRSRSNTEKKVNK